MNFSHVRRLGRPLAAGAVFALALFGNGLRAQDARPPRGRDGDREGGGFVRMNPLFAALDTNGDGILDEAELANATASLKKLDRNKDGKLTEEEVRPAFGRGGPGGPTGPGGRGNREGPGQPNVDEVVSQMLQFDKNGDGRLAQDELPERMQRMMARGDTNKDGYLSRDELVQLARAQGENRRPEGGGGEGRPREEERR